MKIFCLAFVLIVSVNCDIKVDKPLNILGIFPYQGKSHFIVFKVLLDELAEKGHNMTVISYYPKKEPLKNYRDIALPLSQNVEGKLPFGQSNYLSLYNIAEYLRIKSEESCRDLVSSQSVRDLISRQVKFDVVVTEQFCTDCGLAIAYKLKAPVVALTSADMMPWHYARIGIPYNPAYIPIHFLGGGFHPTLFERVERTIFHGLYNFLHYIMQIKDQKILAEYWDDIPPVEELGMNVKMFLLYYNFVLTGSRLLPQNVKEVAAYHVQQSKPLTGDLQKFVEGAKHGVVYISYGSMADISNFPPNLLDALLTLFSELPQRFIFKCGMDLNVDRTKVYLVNNWLPQTDILGHPKTVGFIAHGGLGGVTEAMHFGVPMVVMPLFGDQPGNAAMVEESGLGLTLQVDKANNQSLLAAMKTILDPKFQDQVKELSRAWHERPTSSLDTAVFWIEYTARNPNIKYSAPTKNLPWYQIANLDIIGVFTAFGLLLLIIFKSICKVCSKNTKRIEKLKRH